MRESDIDTLSADAAQDGPNSGRNEAAERLRHNWRIRLYYVRDEEYYADIDRALAAERRATVERIRERIMGPDGSQIRSASAYVGLLAILDEEAAR